MVPPGHSYRSGRSPHRDSELVGYVQSLEVLVRRNTPTRLRYRAPATKLGAGRLEVDDVTVAESGWG